MTEQPKFKEWCDKCKKNHIFSLQPCPSCGVYYTPQPASESVKENHIFGDYDCDGCEAYRDYQQ